MSSHGRIQNCIQHNSIEFLDVSILCLHMGGYNRQIMNEASAVLQSKYFFFINSWTLVITGHLIIHTQNECSEVMQWCSYTQAYMDLCPRKIHWCTGKNNAKVKDQLLCPQIPFFQSVCLVHIQMKVNLHAKNVLRSRSNLRMYNFKIFSWWKRPPATLADGCYACTA